MMNSLLNLTGLVPGDGLPAAPPPRPSLLRRIKDRLRGVGSRRTRNSVVITGAGVVSPIGNGLDEFWNGLMEGRTGMDRITRFDASSFPCQVAAEVSDEGYLEYLNSRERKHYARSTRYAVAAFRMARRDAALDHLDEFRTGVILGSGVSSFDYMEEQIENHPSHLSTFEPGRMDPLGIVKAFIAAPAAAVALAAGTRGYTTTVSTACTSGVNAVGLAAEHIKSGRADVMIAGGVDAPISKIILNAFCSADSINTDNQHPDTCLKPFDLHRTKSALGEGAAVFILESREHAIARGARIYAEVEGFNQQTENGNELFFHDQTGEKWAATIRAAMQNRSDRVDHINAHGPGDKYTDKAEVEALDQALGERSRPPSVTSIKSATGSGIAAAGSLQIAAALMSVFTGQVPGIRNYRTPDPELGTLRFLKKSRKEEPGRVLINSRGFGGFNTALLLRRFAL